MWSYQAWHDWYPWNWDGNQLCLIVWSTPEEALAAAMEEWTLNEEDLVDSVRLFRIDHG